MATAVLVHGAWQGPWCWERLTPLLAASGHDAVTPTLTGSGSDTSRLTPDVDLATHVSDITATIRDLDDPTVVLVGHSYSGMVLPGVAEEVVDRLATVVFVDAFYPRDGDTAIGLMPEPFRERFRSIAATDGDGWRLPASDALLDVWGLDDPVERTWVGERLTDWSLTCFETACHAPSGRIAGLPRRYVAGTKDCPSRAVFAEMARSARADGCTITEARSGHDVMVEAPEVLADVLVDELDHLDRERKKFPDPPPRQDTR